LQLRNGTVHSRRSFPRPQRFPLTRIPFRGPWSSPDASLTHKPANFTRRPFRSATARRFAPAAEASTPQARCTLCRFVLRAAPPISTPLREFSFPPDQSVRLVTRPSGPPSRIARSSFAPRSNLFLIGCGSTFPIRYVSGGLLFLKPLGTFLTMILSRLAVNGNCVRFNVFQQLLSGVFRMSYETLGVNPLCIKHALRNLLKHAFPERTFVA
jgi:hypothetical protein